MKRTLCMLMAGLMLTAGIKLKADKPIPSKISVNRLVMKGEIIDDENISFNLKFSAESEDKGWLTLVSGKVCEKESSLIEPGKFLQFWADDIFSIKSRQGVYFLDANGKGKCDVSFDFFSRVEKRGDWRESSFNLLPAIARVVEIYTKRKDVELEIPGALKVIKKDAKNGGSVFHAALPPEGIFSIKWRSHVDDLDAKLVVSVTPAIVSEALPGTVHTSSVFNYKVIQGKLSSLELKISDDLNILKVQGDDIQDWRVEKTGNGRLLKISLSREFEKDYRLLVKSEKVLPKFPCDFTLPKILPQNVLRIDGYLAFGTNKAVKLIIGKTTGLNQIDTRSYPIKLSGCELPSKSLYTYSFSGNEYSLETSADNIHPSYTVWLNHTVSFKDEDMIVKSYISMDVKDAPIRELMIRFPDGFSVNRVLGRSVKQDDYNIIKKGKEKWLRIPFKKNTIGKVDIEINLEKNIRDQKTNPIPVIFIDKAKSVRGELLLAAGRGLSIKTSNLKNLRKFHGSPKVRISGLQLSYKFKEQDWSGQVALTHEKTSFVSDIFHLATVGEGAVYGMSIFNYRISGAPVDKIVLGFDKSLKNPEFTGGSIIDWKKVDEDENHNYWQVNFREKLFGDYKLLTTYETMLSSDNDVTYKIGDVFTKDADAESGFIVISSKRNLEITHKAQTETVLKIEQTELPFAYKSMVQNPILKLYKFYQSPHWVDIGIKAYPTKKLIGTAVDYAMLDTQIDKNGEIVTKVEYRIKNTTAQFLSINLPENAKLWTVKVDDKRKRVSESSKRKGHYLIPVPRKKDTDEPIKISLSYAQKTDKELGASIDIPLKAPELDVDTMKITWKVNIPDNYDFINFNGNMLTKVEPRASGFSGVFAITDKWIQIFINKGLIPPFLLISFFGTLLAFSWGRKQFRIFISIISLLGIGYGIYLLPPSLKACSEEIILKPSVHSASFTKLFTMAVDTPVINIHLDDMQATSTWKIVALVLCLILAIGLFRKAMQKKSSILGGFGVIAVIYGFSQWLSASLIMALLLPTLIPIAITLAIWILVFRRSRQAMLMATSALALFFMGFNTLHAESDPIVIKSATYQITASNEEVKTIGSFVVKAEKEGTILIVPSPAAITGEVPENSDLKIERIQKNYYLKVKDAGTYKFDLQLLLPLKEEQNGIFSFPLPLPDSRKNVVNATVSQKNFDLTSNNAVSYKSKIENGKVSIIATFVPGTKANFKLTPLKRKVKEEAVQFFATSDASAKFAGGFVEINYAINFNIAQGEISKFAFDVPDNMGITSVSVPNLGAWKYSPETDLLEVFLRQPKRDALKMNITAQIANCSLPYEKEIAMLKVREAGKQHGTLGISADPSVQLEIVKTSGFSKINTDDFSHGGKQNIPNLKKAFRYFETPAVVKVKAVSVEPEIRVNEKCVVSFEDEKTTLISDLSIETTKAGVFSNTINIPKGFDVDKVTGPSIRNWDEIDDKDGHRVIVHFDRRMLGTTSILLELITEKQIKDKTYIPRISVEKVQKHKGSLTVKLERGTRMDILEKSGIEVAASGFSRPVAGTSQNFSIIRSDWKLKIAFEIASPWVQAENLQIGRISDGSMDFNAIFHYKIENAGVKHFKVELPEGAEVPEFMGKDILTYSGNNNGVWDIELNKKANTSYKLHVKFRMPYKTLKNFSIQSVKALDIGLAKGYMAIMTEDSIQVKPAEINGELSEFDARKIPTSFKQKNLSNAVLCYKTVGTDYSLNLNLNSHKAAELLGAKIEKLDIVSIVSEEGNVITKMLINLKNIGNQNLLRLKLPEKSQLWSVFIDKLPDQDNPGQPVEAAEEQGTVLVPLKQKDETQVIEMIYSLPANEVWKVSDQVYNGPKFNLPLKNISWTLYLPEKYNYKRFSGTLEYNEKRWVPVPEGSVAKYDQINNQRQYEKKHIARKWLSKANKATQAGNMDIANDAYRNAAEYALNDTETQEDVQGDWKDAQRVNVINLLQQRSAKIPQAKNLFKQSSDFTVDQLSGKELQTFNDISDKIFKQQQAATNEAKPLQFTIPENGTMLKFTRALQNDKNEPMQIAFAASPALRMKTFNPWVAGALLTLVLAICFKLAGLGMKKQEVIERKEKIEEPEEDEEIKKEAEKEIALMEKIEEEIEEEKEV